STARHKARPGCRSYPGIPLASWRASLANPAGRFCNMEATFVFDSKLMWNAFAYLRPFQTTVNMHISHAGIKIETMDSSHVCLLELDLRSTGARHARFSDGMRNFVVGAQVESWCTVFRQGTDACPHARIVFKRDADKT